MIIKSLSVTNFRNHLQSTLRLSDKVNLLYGANAQGKTNLLEAVYLTCVGRGWRTARDREMISFDKDFAHVATRVQKRFGECNVEVSLGKQHKKTVKINSIPIKKMGELMGSVNCVFFSPDELRLIKEAPSDRRRFLDIDISQIDKKYFYTLVKYSKVLVQRNALLKSYTSQIAHNAEERSNFMRSLDIWDGELVKYGSQIIARRLAFINSLKQDISKIHSFLAGENEHIELSYINITDEELQTPLRNTDLCDTDNEFSIYGKEQNRDNKKCDTCHIEKQFESALRHAREKDLRLRTTSVGPHRDDIKITINGKDVRYFASQGQQRTVALSLKLAELDIFKSVTGEMPVLLLDDVLSELDEARQERLVTTLSKCQSIITSTTIPACITPANASIFNIVCGQVKTRTR